MLSTAGFEQVTVLRGGMERWNNEGLPVERSNSKRFKAPNLSEKTAPERRFPILCSCAKEHRAINPRAVGSNP
jgi:3-mercaptopyruvate sulfurtransferase SseA